MLKKILRKHRQEINHALKDIEERQFISPALFLLTQKIYKVLANHAQGHLLDIGCGDMPFKHHLPKSVSAYDTLDREQRIEGVTYIGSVLDMHMVKANAYDSAMCFEVLEHVPNPFRALAEINRVLKKDGKLIISVPHMWPIHEAPHDYLRFTNYGLTHVLEENQFEIESLEVSGGILSFLGHQLSLGILCVFWGIPTIRSLMFFLVKWFIVLPTAFVDDKLLKSVNTPLEYLCVARKKGNI